MSIVRWSPAARLLSRWPDFWDDDDFGSLVQAGNSNLDLYETDDEVVVKANVAGAKPDQVEITFEKGVLWIRSQQVAEEKNDKKKFYSKSSWSYSYKVAVPGMIDMSQEPVAEVEHGVLTVTFKKAEASKPKKLTVTARAK